ncbi:MAG: FGGY-family carbohydrate kinase [Clostridiales bacterium]|nr:FGGY-family carbohydrate kinase [Clostridiales bacterium]
METGYVLVLDCGTQSMRAIVYDNKGDLLGVTKVKYPKYEMTDEGFIEMHPDIFWNSAVSAVDKFWEQSPEVMKQVVAVTLASQRSTSVFVDLEGRPLRNAISWMDTRKIKDNYKVSGALKKTYKMMKVWDIVDNYNRSCPYHWVDRHEPELMEKVHKLLFLSTYINFKMTGLYRDSVTSASGYIPFSAKRLDWAKRTDIEGRIFYVNKEHLFDLVDPGEEIGKLTEACAAQFKLPSGIPVIAAGSDKACETLGVGCFDTKTVSVSLASMVTVQTTTENYMPLYTYGTVYPAAMKGKYNPELGICRGFWLVSWFIDEFAELEKNESSESNISIERLLNEKLDKVPPGSDGLLMQPYWMSDVRHPGASGTLIGLNDKHTRIHFYRALVEGLGYSIKEGLKSIELKTSDTIEKIGLSGGGAQSDILCQLLANLFNKKVYVVQSHETSALGAAVLSYVHLNKYKTVEEAVSQMVRITKTYEPEAEVAKQYEKLYQQVYKLTYKRLQPVYKKMIELKIRK